MGIRAALLALGGLTAWSCGSEPGKKNVRHESPPASQGGEEQVAGAGGDSTAAGNPARGGAGASSPVGGGGMVGEPASGGQGGAVAVVAGGEGGVAASIAGEGGGVTMAGAAGEGGQSVIDVGPGCIAPPAATPLSAADEALPPDGLRLWLRADRGVYATVDDRVCAWADQSGNGHLFLASASTRPLWGASELGAQPGVYFDQAGSYVSVTGVLGIPTSSARTLVAVVQMVNTAGRFDPLEQGQVGSPGTYLSIDTNSYGTAGSREGVYVTNNAYDTTLATSTSPRVHVFTLGTLTPGTAVLSTIDYRVNGATQTLTRNAIGLGNGNVEDFSSANFTAVGRGTQAIVAEALLYDRALSVVERASVETALKARYGVQ